MKALEYWKPNSFEISSYRWSLKERINQIYHTSGSDNTKECTYTYNELGFRGESIEKDGFKIMSIGCSITEGVGVNDHETWPRQFSKLIPNSVDLNFGTGGRSNDFISRCLLSYFDLIKPNLVIIMYTYPQRREIYPNNSIEPYMPTSTWGYLHETEEGRLIQKNLDELQNSNSDFINWYKNHLLIKNFLEMKNCNWIWCGDLLNTSYYEFNRFDGFDKNNFLDKGVDKMHPGPEHHKYFSSKLFDYISMKFPNYLTTINKSYSKFV